MLTADRQSPAWFDAAPALGPGGSRRPVPQPVEPPPVYVPPPDVLAPEADDVRVLAAEPVDPEGQLASGFALLTVRRAYDQQRRELFGLTGSCGDGLKLPYTETTDQLRPSAIRLANARAGGEWPGEVYWAVRNWSERQTALTTWINTLRTRHGSHLQLLVWDETDYDIPWELLWVPADPRRHLPAGHLGALVTVARWTTLREESQRPLDRAEECTGDVLGYYHRKMLRDADVFANFAHRPHLQLRPMLGKLKKCAGPGGAAGLVYLGCHGVYGEELAALRIGEASWSDINGSDLSALREHSTLVCLNACHSGRFVHNLAQGEDALRGFAELFLRKGARGCIASTGEVGDAVAHQVIRDLVRAVTDDPAAPVARTLRDFRARAAEAVPPDDIPWLSGDDGAPDKEGQIRLRTLLYAFMFLYFGPPLTTLRLDPLDPRPAPQGPP